MSALLEISDLRVGYGGLPVLQDVSLSVAAGECVCVVGANGAGKSTLLRAIMNAATVLAGSVRFDGADISRRPTARVARLGIAYVPEEKMLFKPLTVRENLLLGAYQLDDTKRIAANLRYVFTLFPRLKEREAQAAATMSGGEQQMLAIGRGLMMNPRLLMLDEPSLGLAPLMVDEVLDTVRTLKNEGMTILLVEQNVHEALSLADRGYLLQSGRLVGQGTGQELLDDPMVRSAYLGL